MLTFNVFKITQKKTDLFITIIKASDLQKIGKIDWWSEYGQGGYQRPLDQERIKKALRYLFNEDGLYPTSILGNIRGKIDFSPSFPINDHAQFGILRIPDTSLPVWIIDGQHRMYSIFLAARDNKQFENYTVPLTLLNFYNVYEEMRQFFIVNSRQKKVRTDLAQQHLFKTIEENQINIYEFESKDKILAAKSIPLVDFLRLDPNSPWYRKIQMPNELKKNKNHIITQTSMANSLVYILKNFSKDEIDDISETPKKLAIILINYWNALKCIYTQAFEIPQEHSLQKTLGCYVFHMLFYNVFQLCSRNNDYTLKNMINILTDVLKTFSKTEKIDILKSNFWHTKNGNLLARSSGMKNIRELYLKLAQYFDEELLPD